jgi:hypothetical protein
MAHPVTHENVEAARKPFLSNYCYPGALLGAPTLLAIFGTEIEVSKSQKKIAPSRKQGSTFRS